MEDGADAIRCAANAVTSIYAGSGRHAATSGTYSVARAHCDLSGPLPRSFRACSARIGAAHRLGHAGSAAERASVFRAQDQAPGHAGDARARAPRSRGRATMSEVRAIAQLIGARTRPRCRRQTMRRSPGRPRAEQPRGDPHSRHLQRSLTAQRIGAAVRARHTHRRPRRRRYTTRGRPGRPWAEQPRGAPDSRHSRR